MSGIYIPGMEMPKSCWYCRFELNNMCRATIDRMRVESCDRHPNCPLIAVPDHGRLIDADALKEASHYDDHDVCVVDADDIDNAPTIIPADKGGADDV